MLAVPDGEFVTPKRRGRYAPAIPAGVAGTRWTRGYAGVALAFAIGIPVTAWGMSLPNYAPQEYALGDGAASRPVRHQPPQRGRAPDRRDLLHRT